MKNMLEKFSEVDLSRHDGTGESSLRSKQHDAKRHDMSRERPTKPLRGHLGYARARFTRVE